MNRHWLLLLAAVGAEVIGTTVLKLSASKAPVTGYAVMVVLIGLSYYFLSLAMRRVPMGVAHAVWEGVGLVLISVASHFLWGEQLGPVKLAAFALIVTGTWLMARSGQLDVSEPEPALSGAAIAA
jgi:spermidine export protein MdtJ